MPFGEELKRHNREERSVFRLGLDHLRELLLNSHDQRDAFDRCLRTFPLT